MVSLLIGVPTFNRVSTLLKNLDKIDFGLLSPDIKFLIIDNSSEDNTFEILRKKFQYNKRFILKKNKKNIGFSLNLLNLFKYSTGDYLFLLSDEDFIHVENLNRLLFFLDKKKPNLVVSSVNIENGTKYKNFNITTYLKLCNIKRSFAYMSGLVFKVSKSKNYIEFIMDAVINKNCYTQLYPQILLAEMMFSKKKAYVYSEELCTRYVKSHKSQIEIKNYCFFSSRWQQLKDYTNILNQIAEDNRFEIDQRTADKLIQNKVDSIFDTLHHSITFEKPELRKYFNSFLRRIPLILLVKYAIKSLSHLLKILRFYVKKY